MKFILLLGKGKHEDILATAKGYFLLGKIFVLENNHLVSKSRYFLLNCKFIYNRITLNNKFITLVNKR